MGTIQFHILSKHIRRLADGANDVIDLHLFITAQILYPVIGVIHGRTNQLRKTGIQNTELLGFANLHIKHSGDKRTALGDNRTSRLEMYLLPRTELKQLAEHREVVVKSRYRQMVRMIIVNAQSSAEV